MKQNVAVFCGSHLGRNPRFEESARQLGALIARQGRTLVYGGSNLGYMGTVSSAALAEGGAVVGIIPTLFSDEIIYSQPDIEIVKVASMAERKERMIASCDAFIALPGGIGTIDEVTEVMVANQLGRCCKPVGILNIDGFYNALLQQLSLMVQERLLGEALLRSLLVSDSPEELLQMIDAFDLSNF